MIAYDVNENTFSTNPVANITMIIKSKPSGDNPSLFIWSKAPTTAIEETTEQTGIQKETKIHKQQQQNAHGVTYERTRTKKSNTKKNTTKEKQHENTTLETITAKQSRRKQETRQHNKKVNKQMISSNLPQNTHHRRIRLMLTAFFSRSSKIMEESNKSVAEDSHKIMDLEQHDDNTKIKTDFKFELRKNGTTEKKGTTTKEINEESTKR